MTDGSSDLDLLVFVRSTLDGDTTRVESAAVTLHEELIALGGRISALVERPTRQGLEATRLALVAASAISALSARRRGKEVMPWAGWSVWKGDEVGS